MLRVLVDADNVPLRRLQPVLDLLGTLSTPCTLTAAGRPHTLERANWPADATLLPSEGWQRADLALAAAYSPTRDPLVLISGDGDFGLLAGRHPGPVLVISGAASGRLRDGATVVDPGLEGVAPVRSWLAGHEQRFVVG